MKKLNVGVIGLGQRGYQLLKDAICERENVRVSAVCDLYPDRTGRAAALVAELDGNMPVQTTDYRELLHAEGVDAVIIPAGWESHIHIAVEAMRAGKPVAVEVGGAYSVEECWDLVRTYEQTGTPCMMLENCCYGREELMVLNMARQGLFGSIVHCQGGYCHDLRGEISGGRENRHYRLRNYMNRNCENYPTHELGPIAKLLNINRGNRMLTLTSTASCARGLNDYALRGKCAAQDLASYPFAQGDVVTTVIRCAHGETICLTLDTTLPRFYSRRYEVHGTRGMYSEDTRSIFLDGVHQKYDGGWEQMWNNIESYRGQYEHPIWRNYLTNGLREGHGGMDGIEFDAFFAALERGMPMPIDVYDMAAWMSITALSEQSIAMGGAVVPIPDFTNGRWVCREEEPAWEFSLSSIGG